MMYIIGPFKPLSHAGWYFRHAHFALGYFADIIVIASRNLRTGWSHICHLILLCVFP